MARENPTQLNDSVYEFYRSNRKIDVEFVFFHGLCFSEYLDSYKTTWEVEVGSRSVLRDMIPGEFPRARVLSVSYDACAKVSDEVGRMDFRSLGIILVQDLIHLAKVGQRGCPVVLVGYCLGGLIIKQLCTEAERQFDQARDGSTKGRLDNFLTNVRVIEFIDTPHAGSKLRDHLIQNRGCDGPVLEYLNGSSALLGQLNSDFDTLANDREWKRFCWRYAHLTKSWDTLELPNIEVVSEPSARRGEDKDGEFFTINAAHSGRALRNQSDWDYYMKRPRDFVSRIIGLAYTKIPRITRAVHEFYRPDGECEVEFVFFHGLCLSEYQDAYKTTWLLQGEYEDTYLGRLFKLLEDENSKDSKKPAIYWIRESLPDKFPQARILSVSYDSRAKIRSPQEETSTAVENPGEGTSAEGRNPEEGTSAEFSDPVEESSFSKLGKVIVNDIIHVAKVGQRGCPVVLVGYGLGGLIIKQVCMEARRQYDDKASPGLRKGRLKQFLANVGGIEYLGTPQSGSILEAHSREPRGGNSLLLDYLTESGALFEKLTTEFEMVKEKGWKQHFVWYRTRTRDWVELPDIQAVQEESAIQGVEDVDLSGMAMSNKIMELLAGSVDDILRKNRKEDKQAKVGFCPVGEDAKLHDFLHEIYRPAEEDTNMELIFFPSRELLEHEDDDEDACTRTWKSEDGKDFWLREWLPKALPKARILRVSYDPMIDLHNFVENLIQDVLYNEERPGEKKWDPMVLVGHSSGGLVIKELCNKAEEEAASEMDEAKAKACKEFLRCVRGIAYYGFPFSRLRSMFDSSYPGDDIDLSSVDVTKEKKMQRSNIKYKQLLSNWEWKEITFGETRPTNQGSRKGSSIEDLSATNGIQRNSFFPLPGDHFTICRPKSPVSNSFQYLVHFINTTMNEAQYVNMNVRRKKRRGIAIIITMEEGRPGSKAERIRLEEMAEYISLEPFMLQNRPAETIRGEIDQILKDDLREDDECVLCCVAAHGKVEEEIQYIHDTENKKVDVISSILQPICAHQALAGKPKVFVINACRVSHDDDGTTDLLREKNDLKEYEDCLLMYSTEKYTESRRLESGLGEGSLVLTDLTFYMRLLHQTTDVEDIFYEVQEKVAQRAATRWGALQCPVIHSTLRRRISWRSR